MTDGRHGIGALSVAVEKHVRHKAGRAAHAGTAADAAQGRLEILGQHRGDEETVAGIDDDILEQSAVCRSVVAIEFVHPKPRPVGRQITFGAVDACETEGPIARVLVGARKDCAESIDPVASELPGQDIGLVAKGGYDGVNLCLCCGRYFAPIVQHPIHGADGHARETGYLFHGCACLFHGPCTYTDLLCTTAFLFRQPKAEGGVLGVDGKLGRCYKGSTVYVHGI